jgi:peptidoglycan-associated lipoprotein
VEFGTQSGGTAVYFGANNSQLGAPAVAVLQAQAAWLRRHPEVVVRIEGHGDASDTRDHALAVGARRAQEVRNYLVLLGVPAAQLSATSFGKERPGAGRAVTVLVR